ncbi:MAG: hypothetical protein O7C75_10170 [Verrucomicrobia bacterium]|nr:hypothetical protein [Verrucomicrobiota bacterium]
MQQTNPQVEISFELNGLEEFDLVVNATPVGRNTRHVSPNMRATEEFATTHLKAKRIITNGC